MLGLPKNADTLWPFKSVICLRYYNPVRFRSDVMAAMILALQAFPVCVAISVFSGVPPVNGIYCAAAATFLASALGESKVRICAPSVIFIAVASSIVSRHGIDGLSLCTMLAGFILIFLAATRLGAAVRFIPSVVTNGFSTGIAILVTSGLIADFLGLRIGTSTDGMAARALRVTSHLNTISFRATVLAIATTTLIFACRKNLKIPAGLAAIVSGALLVKFYNWPVEIIATGIGFPSLQLHPLITRHIGPAMVAGMSSLALAVAILVAMESVRAASLASNLSGERHDPLVELLVAGGANIACSLLGGLPASGSNLQTPANARSGAQTPVAGMLQGVFLLAILFLTGPLIRFIPLAMISGILLWEICRMTHWREIPNLLKLSRAESGAWLVTSCVTIIADLPTAVAVGMFLALFLSIPKPTAIVSGKSPVS